MKRSTKSGFAKSVAVCGLIVAGALAAAAGGCDRNVEQPNAALTLGSQLRKATTRPAAPINVAELTDFAWDRLFIFAPFTAHNDIHESLGFHWSGVATTNIHQSDVNTLLVFVKDQRVLGWCEYPRVKADFSLVSSTTGYAPKDAVFNIRTEKAWPTVAMAKAPVKAATAGR